MLFSHFFVTLPHIANICMNKYTQFTLLSLSTLRMVPHILCYLWFKKRVDPDLACYSADKPGVLTFIKVSTRQRVFRNLFYYRLGEYRSVFIKWLLPPEPSLYITCPHIGRGCHFEHNYSTYLNADSIGDDFYCLHLVTLGNGKNGRPTIGNHVSVYTGASIFGGIHIGDNVVIGAGTVVMKDVPSGCTVVGNPARIVKRDGLSVNEKL